MSKALLSLPLLMVVCCVPAQSGPSERVISLAGEWRLRLDPADAGIDGQWFKQGPQFGDRIQLPGSTDEQHLGNKNEKRERGHLTRAYEYVGPAWYAIGRVRRGSTTTRWALRTA